MSLYGGLGLGLPETKKDGEKVPETPKSENTSTSTVVQGDTKKTWNAGLKLMAPQLRRKRAAELAARASALRAAKAAGASKPAAIENKGLWKKKTVTITKASETIDASLSTSEPFIQTTPAVEIKDEYDPQKPNDYEYWVHIIKKEEEAAGPKTRKSSRDTQRVGGAAIAPPPMLVGTIGDPTAVAPKNNVLFGAKQPRDNAPRSEPTTDDAFADPFANLPVAGYNAADTGSASAASVQPSDSFATKAASIGMSGDDAYAARARMSGRPIPAAARDTGTGATAAPPMRSGLTGIVDVSRVVLLTNLVGAGEVDNELRGETADECSKFGTVVTCQVYECQPGTTIAEEAVRIFVEFARQEAAQKAVKAMNGRFFGGRVVRAHFYDLQKFLRKEYL
eukprot:m.792943 g.792943  ORF g.792943 m.792943 type:complete len:394 (+) comp23333_c0_seq5:248-1429(+)